MKNNWLPLEIAAGIVLGVTCLGAIERYRENQAIEQFNESIRKLAAENPPPQYRPSMLPPQTVSDGVTTELRNTQAAKNRPMAELPPGERCIGKQLFRRLPNGFEQVTDGSEKICVDRSR